MAVAGSMAVAAVEGDSTVVGDSTAGVASSVEVGFAAGADSVGEWGSAVAVRFVVDSAFVAEAFEAAFEAMAFAVAGVGAGAAGAGEDGAGVGA
jgi:hypothetical protein